VSPTDYAARVHDWRAYDAVSRDVVQRWAYPLVPDNNWCAETDTTYSMGRDFVYKETNVVVSRSAQLAENTVVGAGAFWFALGHTCVTLLCGMFSGVTIARSKHIATKF
jgi:NDP-sugar pyrophosphorylase family protein